MKHFCKTIDHLYEFKPVITVCFPIVQTHAHTKYILPKKKKKKGCSVMKRESTAFRCGCADVCWQPLPSPV